MENVAFILGMVMLCVGPALLIAMATFALTRHMFIKNEYSNVIRLSERRKRGIKQ